MDSSLKGRRQLLRLWKAQDGICPVGDQKITERTGWHHHHIVGGQWADGMWRPTVCCYIPPATSTCIPKR